MNKVYEEFRARELCGSFEPYTKDVSRYLDFGCGDGIFTHTLVSKMRNVNNKTAAFALDIRDLRYEEIKKLNSFTYLNDLSLIESKKIDLCTIIDVVHHIQSDLCQCLHEVAPYIRPGGKIIIKDYVLSINEPFKTLQKLSLTLKDIVANPREMVKGFNYLNNLQWNKLFEDLNLTNIASFPFHYLPGEKYYSKFSGQAWIWVLLKN